MLGAIGSIEVAELGGLEERLAERRPGAFLGRGIEHVGREAGADLRLHALLPAVFTPPMLRGLQDERNTFTGLRRRKRLERALLTALVGWALLGARFGVKLCAKALLGAG